MVKGVFSIHYSPITVHQSLLLSWQDAYGFFVFSLSLVADDSVNFCVEGIIFSTADIYPGVDFSSELADEDIPGSYPLT